jgi:hypothetical protein
MMDDGMYPVDAVRPLAHSLRSAALSWHDADHRLVEKFAEDMTMQDFLTPQRISVTEPYGSTPA